MEQTEKTVHEIKMDGRAVLRVSGVEDVIGFDETSVVLCTCMDILNIDGSGLHIVKLDVSSGTLEIEGHIDSLYYTVPASKKRGLFGSRER